MRHACVLKGGEGKFSWGRLALVFPGFARFPHVAHFRSFHLSFDKFTENSLFLRNGAFLWVVTRKIVLSAECGVQFVSNFRQTFESASFCGPERNVVLSAEREKLIRSPCGSLKVFKKFARNRPFCGGKRLKSWYGAPKNVRLTRSPPYLHLFLGLLISPTFDNPNFLFFGFWLRWEWFFLKKRAPYQPSGVHKMGPLINPSGYIYIYIILRCFLVMHVLKVFLTF